MTEIIDKRYKTNTQNNRNQKGKNGGYKGVPFENRVFAYE